MARRTIRDESRRVMFARAVLQALVNCGVCPADLGEECQRIPADKWRDEIQKLMPKPSQIRPQTQISTQISNITGSLRSFGGRLDADNPSSDRNNFWRHFASIIKCEHWPSPSFVEQIVQLTEVLSKERQGKPPTGTCSGQLKHESADWLPEYHAYLDRTSDQPVKDSVTFCQTWSRGKR